MMQKEVKKTEKNWDNKRVGCARLGCVQTADSQLLTEAGHSHHPIILSPIIYLKWKEHLSRVARTSPLCKEVLLYRGVGTGGSVEWGHKINTKYETKKILQPISVAVRNLFFPAILCFFCFLFPVSEWVSGNFLPAYYHHYSAITEREKTERKRKKITFCP